MEETQVESTNMLTKLEFHTHPASNTPLTTSKVACALILISAVTAHGHPTQSVMSLSTTVKPLTILNTTSVTTTNALVLTR